MRGLAFVSLLVAIGTQALSHKFEEATFVAFVVTFIVCAVALCEQTRAIPTVYRPFARWGWIGRLAGKFFYPGWHTGVLFSLGMFAAFGTLLIHEKVIDMTAGSRVNDQAVWFVALIGTLLMPAALIRGVFRRTERPVTLFFAVQVICLILTVCVLISDNALRTSYRDLLTFVPLCALLAGSAASHVETASRLIAVGVTTLVSLVVLLVASVPAFRQTRRLERESLALPAAPRNPLPPTPPPAPPHAPLA